MRLFRKAEKGGLVKGVCRLCGVEGTDSLPSRVKGAFIEALVKRSRSLDQAHKLLVDPGTGKVDWLVQGWFKLLPQHPANASQSQTTRHLQVECTLDRKVRPFSCFRKARCVRWKFEQYMMLFRSGHPWRMWDCSF